MVKFWVSNQVVFEFCGWAFTGSGSTFSFFIKANVGVGIITDETYSSFSIHADFGVIHLTVIAMVGDRPYVKFGISGFAGCRIILTFFIKGAFSINGSVKEAGGSGFAVLTYLLMGSYRIIDSFKPHNCPFAFFGGFYA